MNENSDVSATQDIAVALIIIAGAVVFNYVCVKYMKRKADEALQRQIENLEVPAP